MTAEIAEGEAVLIKREPVAKREGPTRFQERVYRGIFKVQKKHSPGSFTIADLADERKRVPFKNPVGAERIIRIELPELSLDPMQPKMLELRRSNFSEFEPFEIVRFSRDGRVCLQSRERSDSVREWFDLSKHEYRWLIS